MKNKLIDLNNHLFAQLERLSDESLKGDILREEIARSKSVADIAKEIVENGKLILESKKAMKEWGLTYEDLPQLSAGNWNGHGKK